MAKRKTTATGGIVPRQPQGGKRASVRTVAGGGIVGELRQAIADAGKHGITQYRLAKLSGMTTGAISRFMAGQREPSLATAEKIARALGKRLSLGEELTVRT